MNALLVILAAATVFGLGLLLLNPILKRFVRREVAEANAVPIASNWLPLLQRHVPIVGRLTPDQRRRLLLRARELITTVHWEGSGGLTLTPEMRLVIAAQAALLVLELPADAYINLRAILVYPSGFVPRRSADLRKWVQDNSDDPPVPLLGEAWNRGTVVVSWDDALAGGANPDDGRNVILHEFAHMLDYQKELTGRVLTEPSRSDRDVFRRLIAGNYERLCAQIDAGEATVLDRYAATNEQEFFAVATEVFFEQPAGLKAGYPELYAGLQYFYRQDPLLLHGGQAVSG
jgi:Mlc titration factor MtfA (ptsG expression regulator)